MTDQKFPGARWLRCDLHVHTPFDGTKRFKEDVRNALGAAKDKNDWSRLREMACRFFDFCRRAELDLVAITDHNSVDGYKVFSKFFDEWKKQTGATLTILPGVEITIGGERNLHVLLICEKKTPTDWVDSYLTALFEARPRHDDRNNPLSCRKTLFEFCRFTRDRFEESGYQYLLIPAHVNSDDGIDKELRSASLPTWEEELRGVLRDPAFAQRNWAGFQVCGDPNGIPGLPRLLRLWATAFFFGKAWDQLEEEERRMIENRKHWPIIEASDPQCYDNIGTRYTWLKMEVPDVEGIRLALLDPESRLRRMADGPPGQSYPCVERIKIRNTDFFDEKGVEIPFSPCLTTIIGGRGTGKSTVLEYVRWALDRARPDDFPGEKAKDIREDVDRILEQKSKRDFGETNGTLLPESEIELDLVVAQHRYRVLRTTQETRIVRDPDTSSAEKVTLDLRALIAPRIFSQRQIARIAQDPALQRSELDALLDRDQLAQIEKERAGTLEQIQQLQMHRARLKERLKTLLARKTELQKVNDQIEFLEQEGCKEVLDRFQGFERQRLWVDTILKELRDRAQGLEEQAEVLQSTPNALPVVPSEDSSLRWINTVSQRVVDRLRQAANTLRAEAHVLRQLADTIQREKMEQWEPTYNEVRTAYEALRAEMNKRGVDFSQHERLLQQRADLERELEELRSIDSELQRVHEKIQTERNKLIQLHDQQRKLRRQQAQILEDLDVDIRIEIVPFGDRQDFQGRWEEWFGGSGVQERDWEILVHYVFDTTDSVPERIAALVEALRADIEASVAQGRPLEKTDSNVVRLLGQEASDKLTGHFFRALLRPERIRLDDMERFLPEDALEARVRTPGGDFKPITTGSVGERSMAILSLLLSAGDQPLIIDQPEDDLDNRYVYEVVVQLLRQRKFSRQIIVATHNANIPVNGDAELIVALGAENRLGAVIRLGSIDQPEIKDLVTAIMEGGAEAFRLRRERYGY